MPTHVSNTPSTSFNANEPINHFFCSSGGCFREPWFNGTVRTAPTPKRRTERQRCQVGASFGRLGSRFWAAECAAHSRFPPWVRLPPLAPPPRGFAGHFGAALWAEGMAGHPRRWLAGPLFAFMRFPKLHANSFFSFVGSKMDQ
uniref:Uncharacterized protein n=1 Tax=Eutreptiella gymnastica TaxID=73025 RepID=A0A7S1J0E2_9EUGL